MPDDQITFAQLRACLQVAGEILTGEISHAEVDDRLHHACDRQGAEYRVELIDVANMLAAFGKAARHD